MTYPLEIGSRAELPNQALFYAILSSKHQRENWSQGRARERYNWHLELCMEKTYRVNLGSAFAQVPPTVVSVPEASALASAAISRTVADDDAKEQKSACGPAVMNNIIVRLKTTPVTDTRFCGMSGPSCGLGATRSCRREPVCMEKIAPL